MLYSGEQSDPVLEQYYRRARYYNPETGRFNRRDPLEVANRSDPQSLHKYVAFHCDPVNGIDASGEMTLVEMTAVVALTAVVVVALIRTVRFFFRKIGRVEVYVSPNTLQGTNEFHTHLLAVIGYVEGEFSQIVPTTITGAGIPSGSSDGYDSSTKTYRVGVAWDDDDHEPQPEEV